MISPPLSPKDPCERAPHPHAGCEDSKVVQSVKYDLVLAVYVPEHSPKLTFHPALTELASKLMGWFRDFKKTLIQEYLTWP